MAGSTHEKIKARRVEIRRLHGEGKSVNQIAAMLDIGIQTAYTDHRALGLTPNPSWNNGGHDKRCADRLRRRCVQCGSTKGITTFKKLRLCEDCIMKYDNDPLYEERQRFEIMRGFRSSCLSEIG